MGLLTVLAALAVSSPLAAAAASSANYLNLDLRQDRFLGEVQHSAQESNFTQLGLRANVEPVKRRWLTYKLTARAQGAFEVREESYFGVPELFAGTNTAPLRVFVGRRKKHWSQLDEQFHLGVWQPELRWDYLNPEQQGLTGVFVELRASSALKFHLFTSPVNLPDQGPQYKLENGQFSSTNRWFQQPSGALGLFSGTSFASNAPLYFQLDKPANQDLFFNPSLGGGIEYEPETGFFARANYAYKPRNQIHLGLECRNCGNIGAQPVPLEITAVIHPKIIMHHVATLETGFNRVDDRGLLSFTVELPDRSGFPEDYEEAPLDDVFIAGASYQHYLGTWLGGRPSWLQYSYVRVFELGAKSKESVLREDEVQSSLDRYPLNEIAALDWKLLLSERRTRRIHLTNRYWYSVPEQGGWLSSQIEWREGALTWMLGTDILGSQVSPQSDKAGLFTRYRANDRVFGGVSYVF